jgi:nucleoid DNA-binding protein
MKQEEIFEVLEKEFNLEQKHVKLIVDSFWSGLRKYLTNPLESKGRIIIPHIGTFNISKVSVDRVKNKLEQKEIKRLQTVRSIDFYTELANVLKTNERQARKQTDNE